MRIYSSNVKITRPVSQAGSFGAQGYGGMVTAQETVVRANVKASIQQKSISRALLEKLPGDVRSKTLWRVFIRLPRGTVEDRDILTDLVTGDRYQVNANYWTALGYNLLTEKLEV